LSVVTLTPIYKKKKKTTTTTNKKKSVAGESVSNSRKTLIFFFLFSFLLLASKNMQCTYRSKVRADRFDVLLVARGDKVDRDVGDADPGAEDGAHTQDGLRGGNVLRVQLDGDDLGRVVDVGGQVTRNVPLEE
jgi:hypothetical protein